jgi:ankyrin repeat protein
MAVRRSDQQDGRQGNDYQNVTVGEGGRSILGNVYADSFHMSMLDPQRPHKTDQDEKEEFLKCLRFDVMDSRLATIGIVHRDTCSWLYIRPEYLRWQDPGARASHHGFLWIKGKPGAGKSTLMKHALQHTQSLGQRDITTISFFFNARGHELEKTTEGMYRSLLHQVYKAFPGRLPEVLPNVSSESKNHIWQLPILQNMLREALLNFGNTAQFTCYVDALDECNEDAIRFAIAHFEELGDSSISKDINLSICFASRHYPNITMQRCETLDLDDQREHLEDIKSFVEERLRSTAITPLIHAELTEEISARSSGVFLWAVLVVQILNKRMDDGAKRSQLTADLKTVPAGIEDLLKSILMDGSEFLLPTLIWVLFSTGSLDAPNLCLAIMMGANKLTTEDWDQTETTQQQTRNFILKASKGLVESIRGRSTRTQFIHESVREYLLNGGLSVLDDSLAANLEAKSHSRLAAWCQTAIELDPHTRLRDLEVGGDDDLLGYAFLNLYRHCEDAFKGGALQLNFLDAIPQNTLSRVAQCICSADISCLLILLLDAQQECTHLANGLLRRQLQHYGRVNACATVRNDAIEGTIPYLDVNARDNRNNTTPLISALRCGSSETVQLLLDCGADPNLERPYGPPLLSALETEQFDVVELLLNHGANPNVIVPIRYGRTRTPLATALMLPFESTRYAKLLLDRGADPNIGSQDGMPLLAALNMHNCDSVELLLRCGANLNFVPTHLGVTQTSALVVAQSKRCSKCVKVLIEHGADPNAWLLQALHDGDCDLIKLLLHHGANPNLVSTRYGETQTPLAIATTQQSTRFVKMLLDHGADVNGNSAKLGEPLAHAVSSDLQEIVRLLLAHGADPNGSNSHRPLHLAVGRRDETMARLLLAHGADPNGLNSHRGTALTVAAQSGNLDIVRLLIDNNAKVNEAGAAHSTALIMAVSSGVVGVVQFLLDAGADINATDMTHRTALITAVATNVPCLVRLLLDAGADFNATDVSRRTALVMAAEAGNFEVVRLLVDCGANLDLYGNEEFARYLRQRIVDNAALSAAV